MMPLARRLAPYSLGSLGDSGFASITVLPQLTPTLCAMTYYGGCPDRSRVLSDELVTIPKRAADSHAASGRKAGASPGLLQSSARVVAHPLWIGGGRSAPKLPL